MSKIKVLQLGKGVYQYYRDNVKGNQNTPYEIAQRKLTRNVMLALTNKIDEDKYLFLYGNLHIFVEGNTIVKLENYKGGVNWFWKDLKNYYKLNHKLGINEPKQKRKVS